ncbi:unnamed protein product [Ixodes persulcatus]
MLLDLARPVQVPLAQGEVTQDKAVQVNTSTAPVQNQRLSDLLTTDASVRAYTGIESMALLNAIVRCAEKIHSQTSELTMREKVILVLTKIKTNLSFTCLAINFKISKVSTSRYFHTTLQVLSQIMKAALPWPSKDEVVNNLPRCFQNFANVRVVLDGTEIEIEKAACLACRIWTYSHYKGRHTAKFLVGVSPAGLITFLSDGFGGRSSDKATVQKSNILEKLDSFTDDVMVDKGFLHRGRM